MASEDEEYSGEEEEEELGEQVDSDEESDTGEGDEEEGESGPNPRPPSQKFHEILPPRKEDVVELSLLLPGRGEDKHTVVVMPSKHTSFEATYRAALKKLRRENILKQLEGDHVSTRLFLQSEAAAQKRNGEAEDDDDDEEMEEEEDEEEQEGSERRSHPFWLGPLLSNDTYYVDRVLSTMFGWCTRPEVPPIQQRSSGVSFIKRAGLNGRDVNDGEKGDDDDDDDDEEEEEEREEADDSRGSGTKGTVASLAQSSPVFQDTLPSASYSYQEDEKKPRAAVPGPSMDNVAPPLGVEGSPSLPRGDVVGSDQVVALPKPIGAAHVPPPSVPRFPDSNYPFYIVLDKASEEWHLLDAHPLLWMHRWKKHQKAKEAVAEASSDDSGAPERKGEGDLPGSTGAAADDEDDEEEEGEEEDESDDNEGEEEAEPEEEGGEEDSWPVEPDYDLASIIPVDALMLAALQSPVALRYCLLQREPVSLANVERWVRMDARVGFPLLATIYRALLTIRATDAARTPYPVPRLKWDFAMFFSPAYVYALAVEQLAGVPSGHGELPGSHERALACPSSTATLSTMQGLLQAGLVPSRPIPLCVLKSLESIHLLLWLMMAMPRSTLLEWGSNAAAAAVRDAEAVHRAEAEEDEEEEEEAEEAEEAAEEDESSPSITESVLRRRIRRAERREAAARGPPRAEPPLVPSPLLLHALLEIRRRVARLRHGKPPSPHSLSLCLERVYEAAVLEDGRPTGDPLVTSALCLTEPRLGTSAAGEAGAVPAEGLERHLKVYQSDVVLLLLALTTSPVWRVPQMGPSRKPSERSSCCVFLRTPSAPVDAHLALFAEILRAKMARHTLPLVRARSAMFRMLFQALPRFRQLDTARHLCEVAPLYELLGTNEVCPLHHLTHAWLQEPAERRGRYLDVFVNTFWHEIHFRLEDGHYSSALVYYLRTDMMVLLDKVKERVGLYHNALRLLSGALHRHSRIRRYTLRPSHDIPSETGEEGKNEAETMCASTELAEPSPRAPAEAHAEKTLDPYSDEYRRQESRVMAAFESLPMSPRTYFSPETLYHLLFSMSQLDVVAVRYLLVTKGVVTVRSRPFTEAECPVLEYALRQGNLSVIHLLVGLGCPLDDLMHAGMLMVESFAQHTLTAAEVSPLRDMWIANRTSASCDPAKQYGILRDVRSSL